MRYTLQVNISLKEYTYSMSFTLIVVWIISQGLQVASILIYDPRKGDHIEDTEAPHTLQIPNDKSEFTRFLKDARYLGLLFAGKTEFSWIVDIRIHSTDSEKWSTGNLISPKHVLTTCRAVRLLQGLRGAVDVTFFTLYLWEHFNCLIDQSARNYGKGLVLNKECNLGGTRQVFGYIYRPECSQSSHWKTLSYDIAIIKLATPIGLSPPFISYMPIVRDYCNPHKIPKVRFRRFEKQRRVCLVGSIGRDYVNWKLHMVKDYKVRFRVYWEDWGTCSRMMNKICNKTEHDCQGMRTVDVDGGRDWVCMRTRARVGTVCDHDRGAPVVCDGEVVGIVVFGALWDFCNNRFPIPFVVAKLDQFQDFILRDVKSFESVFP